MDSSDQLTEQDGEPSFTFDPFDWPHTPLTHFPHGPSLSVPPLTLLPSTLYGDLPHEHPASAPVPRTPLSPLAPADALHLPPARHLFGPGPPAPTPVPLAPTPVPLAPVSPSSLLVRRVPAPNTPRTPALATTRIAKRRTPRELRRPLNQDLNDEFSSDENFQPSPGLIAALRARNINEDARPMLDALQVELAAHVDRLRAAVRDEMRDKLDDMKHTLSTKDRTRARSRRGAAVSRVKTTATRDALKCAAEALIETFCGRWAPVPPVITPPMSTLSPPFVPAMSLPPTAVPPTRSGDPLAVVTVTPVTRPEVTVAFELSQQLQRVLLGGPNITEAKAIMLTLEREVADFVTMKKNIVREEYKGRLLGINDRLDAELRIRARSRRGAAVSRFKNTENSKAWRDAVQWLAVNLAQLDHI